MRLVYYFFQSNAVLSSKNSLSPHVLFALDNIIRRVAEHLVGLIRPGETVYSHPNVF